MIPYQILNRLEKELASLYILLTSMHSTFTVSLLEILYIQAIKEPL